MRKHNQFLTRTSQLNVLNVLKNIIWSKTTHPGVNTKYNRFFMLTQFVRNRGNLKKLQNQVPQQPPTTETSKNFPSENSYFWIFAYMLRMVTIMKKMVLFFGRKLYHYWHQDFSKISFKGKVSTNTRFKVSDNQKKAKKLSSDFSFPIGKSSRKFILEYKNPKIINSSVDITNFF